MEDDRIGQSGNAATAVLVQWKEFGISDAMVRTFSRGVNSPAPIRVQPD
ncbi:MAG: hypothetical protein P3W94_004920 [Paracoccus sp. (in: a-proteobacteria)]|nr:hypothetical protein [Paracoccus sp. (in: a-proteobacteria)]